MQLLIQQFCLSICLSRSSVASKWLNMSSYFCQHMVASSFLSTKHHCKIVTGTPPMAALNTGEVYKFQNFSPLSGYMWQTIQDRPCLLWNGNRKSYMLCHTVTFLMTLSDLWRSFTVVTLCARDLLAIAKFLVFTWCCYLLVSHKCVTYVQPCAIDTAGYLSVFCRPILYIIYQISNMVVLY